MNYKNTYEEPARCIVCDFLVADEVLICSATCSDVWYGMERQEPLMDNVDLMEMDCA